MGAGKIVQKNIKQGATALWDKLPLIPNYKFLDFNTSSYNKSFVNLAVVVGIITLVKGSLALGKTLKNSLKSNKLPTAKELSDKYGHHSWVLIANCRQNEQYCNFFAQNGFNLILMRDKQDILKAKHQVQALKRPITQQPISIYQIKVDWKQKQSDIHYYEELIKELENFDISFLVLPKLVLERQKEPSHLQHVQPFEHIYLLVRFFGQKLKFRSYKSGIIFPSYQNYEDISPENGITKALIAGSDAFGRIASYELKNTVEVVVARGSLENAIKGLGVEPVTH